MRGEPGHFEFSVHIRQNTSWEINRSRTRSNFREIERIEGNTDKERDRTILAVTRKSRP
ncbi:hypothetical protein C7445_103130 [Alicyclobacillus sacchari]|uniref:Uncharacterized protein n=1 Tax=Alicyclobacillus sacchari TaxID=392010 RepID=A0A4R8LTI1_9BACL|nr:hypothetical protein C7445_103130 [Alicyclobacillus sacchari]